jgi:hypothetical protein
LPPWKKSPKTWDRFLNFSIREAIAMPRTTQAEVACAIVRALSGEPWYTNNVGIYHREVRLIAPTGRASLHLFQKNQHGGNNPRSRYVCELRGTYLDGHTQSVFFRAKWTHIVEAVAICNDVLREYRRTTVPLHPPST